MTDPWPCSTCQAPGFRNVGSRGYCVAHWCTLVATFDPANLPETGLYVADGPEEGGGYWWCRCLVCGATVVDVPGTTCAWCIDAVNRRWDDQQRLVLTAPEYDPADARYEPAMRAWAERLARAACAGIVTEAQARRALNREVVRARSA